MFVQQGRISIRPANKGIPPILEHGRYAFFVGPHTDPALLRAFPVLVTAPKRPPAVAVARGEDFTDQCSAASVLTVSIVRGCSMTLQPSTIQIEGQWNL